MRYLLTTVFLAALVAAASADPATPERAATPVPEMTLEEIIAHALANNPDIAAGRADIAAASAQRDVAAGARWPSVHALGGYTRFQDAQRLVPPSANNQLGFFSRDLFNAGLVVSLPLYTGGRITNEIRADDLLRRSAEHQLSRTREELVFNVSSTYFSILGQRRVLDSLEFSKKTLREHRKRIADLIEAQKAAKVDLLRTDVRLADIEQQLVREGHLLDIQGRVLANLMGLDEHAPSPLVVGDLSEPKLDEKDLTVAGASGGRADYLAARAALDAQAKRVEIARGARWPTVSVRGSYSGQWAGRASDDGPGTNAFEDAGAVGVFLDIPLFTGGSISAQIRRERASLTAAEQRLRKLQLQIKLDVETALLNIDSARKRIEATQAAINQGKESLRIEQEKYGLGKGSITDVLDAQSALLESQTSYYRALADYHIAQAQLTLATGGSNL
jgi:outer membrane protein TolC